ncbi:acyltransferase [Providencia heimbachae]|uniref:acyltransferase family protein n=1 Tax=Providencia heimbachae TaxID=333962 RepID=UPI00141A41FE|nr:acyltransferase [Providencia heimbachae]NIH23361.1 acyltransferase [Providencia heimbachae]
MKLSVRESICLDLIRAIASQVVVIGHGISFMGIFKFLHEPNFPWMQNMAVVVFFVLSGFVITYSTRIKSADPQYSFFDFFTDRASRIFSAYIVAMFIVFAIDSLSIYLDSDKYTYYHAFNISTFFANFVMLQDYPLFGISYLKEFQHTSFGSARIFWTISIEWWIYMFFGVLFFSLIKKEKVNVPMALVFLISSVVAFGYAYGLRGGHLTIYWMFGMLWMIYYQRVKKILNGLMINLIFLLFSLVVCIVIQLNVINGYNFVFAVFLSVSIICFVNLGNYFSIERFHSVITLIASYSFTLYLIHYSVIDFIFRHIEVDNKYIQFIFAVLICNVLAYIISRYSEIILRKNFKNVMYKMRSVFKHRSLSKN